MNWFEKLTGFPERDYEGTRERLRIEGQQLLSTVNGARYGIGKLELVSLKDLRLRAKAGQGSCGRLRTRLLSADVRHLHRARENAGALFQVASQFNLLEMVSPDVTPEQGVARYESDSTQGPACAMAAGAATIYRNYFVPIDDRQGQTATRQLDGLADIGGALGKAMNVAVGDLWTMRNGYALAIAAGLDAIAGHLATLTMEQTDALRARLRIGVHGDVEVTDAAALPRQLVSQAFCSALPVAYSRVPAARWEPFARLVLEAAYEATLWAGVLNGRRGGSKRVFLTFLGGGAFGNRKEWIYAAIRRALHMMQPFDLDVALVSYGAPSQELVALAREFS